MSEEDNASDSGLYDHTVPKPKNAGLAVLASFLFLGGGQLVKGHYRRFLAIWGAFIALLVIVLGGGFLLCPPGSAAGEYIPTVGAIGYALIWFYQLWDAATHR
jgi:hypothetical protein